MKLREIQIRLEACCFFYRDMMRARTFHGRTIGMTWIGLWEYPQNQLHITCSACERGQELSSFYFLRRFDYLSNILCRQLIDSKRL